ncbi:uncharacterized protein LOC135310262 [Phalacrocorax carbo]|uniref:uncharacterized protein LOC135310262 n=1 Tax=Phalacrocorax carbo TaxID=9209 RepID=UPI0031193C18
MDRDRIRAGFGGSLRGFGGPWTHIAASVGDLEVCKWIQKDSEGSVRDVGVPEGVLGSGGRSGAPCSAAGVVLQLFGGGGGCAESFGVNRCILGAPLVSPGPSVRFGRNKGNLCFSPLSSDRLSAAGTRPSAAGPVRGVLAGPRPFGGGDKEAEGADPEGHFLSLACHRNGSRVLDAVWASASAPARAAIAEELASQRDALQHDPHGRGVARTLALDLFLRRRRLREQLQAAPDRRRGLLGPLLED